MDLIKNHLHIKSIYVHFKTKISGEIYNLKIVLNFLKLKNFKKIDAEVQCGKYGRSISVANLYFQFIF